jgi:hypothetical protein
MTEAEWLSCKSPTAMLNWHGPSQSERKLRLFACACARAVWPLTNEDQRLAIVTAERVADGSEDHAVLAPHRRQGMGVAAGSGLTAAEEAVRKAIEITCEQKNRTVRSNDWDAYRRHRQEAGDEIGRVVCGLARCVFAPFHPGVASPACRTADVLAVAAGAYDERAPDGALVPLRLAVLADALEDAGCVDPALLAHLRSAGPHVRGCWALDVAMGKE